ncbi:YEATS domain-containing protein 4-like [Tetranychus urticae]|uniref:YEATS domain-containing protein 4 n=1 Tax=Tetranychus urticae TaxID=32264 RepID=T1K7Z0_TETUR|nr:YEATS domain-containing protein 4-like [Tetranychus urticae]
MSDYGPDCGGRIKGVTIVKPIVYGNVARHFGKKREEDGHTHSWNVYVKPFQNEDMSTYVKKVHFKLHESYTNPNRIVTKPPFEVTETGWGEFEVSIKLYFMDPNERPITIYHILKLFETDPISKQINIKKYIISEFYDEIIFQDPSAMMQQLLTNTRQLTIGPYKHETDFEDKKTKTIASIQSAKIKVKSEIEELKDRLKQTQTTIAKLKENISSAEAKQELEKKQQAQLQQPATPLTTTSDSQQSQSQLQQQQQPQQESQPQSQQLQSKQQQQQPEQPGHPQDEPMQQVQVMENIADLQPVTQQEILKPQTESKQTVEPVQQQPESSSIELSQPSEVSQEKEVKVDEPMEQQPATVPTEQLQTD